jgi:hypothetical protein
VNNAAGRVFVYNLATATLSGGSSMALAQTIFPNGNQEAGDEFGAALVAFQRDGSGQLDLVVGSPGENGNEGIITLYKGEFASVVVVANVSQPSIPLQLSEAGDRFGSALAVGQLDGAGDSGDSDDLKNPFLRKTDLVITSPGETTGVPTGGPAAGAIHTMLQGSNALVGAGTYHQASQFRE